MTKGVCNRTIKTDCGTYPNRTDHETDLVNDRVGENTPHIVLK